MRVVDRNLRQLLLAMLEDIASAEQAGRWLDAAAAVETVADEVRARAMRSPQSVDAAREERLTRAERGTLTRAERGTL